MSGRCCDTSVLVPALVAWHPEHRAVRERLDGVAAVPAHVLLECYSVLTRLPAPHRVSPGDAAAAVTRLPWDALVLPGPEQAGLVGRLGPAGLRGGAVYDALVAATAHHHGLVLLTRDRRARATYDLLGINYELH